MGMWPKDDRNKLKQGDRARSSKCNAVDDWFTAGAEMIVEEH